MARVYEVFTAAQLEGTGGAGRIGAQDPAGAATNVQSELGRLETRVDTAITEIEGAPVGAVQMYAGALEPDGWLFCLGQAVSRETYSALFGVLDTTYGAGDGSTTFNLPDLRGRAPIGRGAGVGLTGRFLGDQVGTETHTLTEGELPPHSHDIQYFNPQNTSGGAAASRWHHQNAVDNNTTATTDTSGGGAAHPNMQPSIALNFIVKT